MKTKKEIKKHLQRIKEDLEIQKKRKSHEGIIIHQSWRNALEWMLK